MTRESDGRRCPRGYQPDIIDIQMDLADARDLAEAREKGKWATFKWALSEVAFIGLIVLGLIAWPILKLFVRAPKFEPPSGAEVNPHAGTVASETVDAAVDAPTQQSDGKAADKNSSRAKAHGLSMFPPKKTFSEKSGQYGP